MKKSAVFTILALLILAIGIAQRSQQDREYTTSSGEAYRLFEEGMEAFHAFQRQQAEIALRRAVEIDPDFAMAQAILATLVVTADRDSARVLAARADSLARRLPDENERLLIQLWLAGRHLSDGGDRDSLLAVLDQHLPDHEIVLTVKAYRAMENNDGDLAAKIWHRLLDLNPNHARAYNWLGYNAANMGRYDEALTFLHKYAYIAPHLANPHDSLGEILMYMGRYEEAAQEFRKALEIQPDFFVSIINLARVFIEQGMMAKARDILEQLRGQVASTSYERNLDQLLIQVFYQNNIETGMADALQSYVERHPTDEITIYYRAYLNLYQGRIAAGQTACDSFLTVLREMPHLQDNINAQQNLQRLEHSYLALAATAQGHHEQAAREWETVLAASRTLAPHYRFGTLSRYGETLLQLERPVEALQQADQILAVNPRLISGLLLSTESLISLEQWSKAKTTLEILQAALARADPDFPALARAEGLAQLMDTRAGS